MISQTVVLSGPVAYIRRAMGRAFEAEIRGAAKAKLIEIELRMRIEWFE